MFSLNFNGWDKMQARVEAIAIKKETSNWIDSLLIDLPFHTFVENSRDKSTSLSFALFTKANKYKKYQY